MKILIAGLGVLWTFTASAETLQYKAGEVKSLTIRNSTGDVNVAPSTSADTRIALNKVKWGQRCKMDVQNKKGHLTISVDDTNWILDHECRLDLVVSVPQDLKLQLSSGSGDIQVSGTKGDLDVKVGSGDVNIKADIKKLNALSGSGDINVAGLTEEADIKTGSGDVNVSMGEAPKKGRLKVQVGSGDVSIVLPEDLKILSETTTGGGYVHSDFANQADASMQITAKSGAGDIEIRKK